MVKEYKVMDLISYLACAASMIDMLAAQLQASASDSQFGPAMGTRRHPGHNATCLASAYQPPTSLARLRQ